MKKEKINVPMNAKGIVIDGVEYLNQSQAAEMVGLSIQTFKKKVNEFQIESIKRPSGKKLFRRDSIENAIKNGWFKKWFM